MLVRSRMMSALRQRADLALKTVGARASTVAYPASFAEVERRQSATAGKVCALHANNSVR